MRRVVNVIPLSSRGRVVASLVAPVATGLQRLADPFRRGVDRLPSWGWPVLAAIAAWPSLAWTARRFDDGSDDPLGIVAWVALAVALVLSSARFTRRPRVACLVASAVAALATCLPGLFDLVRALVASVAMVLALAAIVDEEEPLLPYAGLVLLALPLLSSVQFYAGFPLRVVTAEASRWLLAAAGAVVARSGSALTVDGHLVLVDAPCSGVQMAWVGYFTAFTSAWIFRVADRAALARLPVVGLLVLGGNVVRNTVLVALEAQGSRIADGTHAIVGLAVLAVVCAGIATAYACCDRRVRPLQRVRVSPVVRSRAPRAASLVVAAFAVAALVPLLVRQATAGERAMRPVEWPRVLDGAPLVPVALSDVEQRFAGSFPGHIARFTNGGRVVVMREAERATRSLHPAVDCYRALGYAIADERLETDDSGRLRRCFAARRGASGLRVCERIVDDAGTVWTDTSAWYWSALLSSAPGPWRAITIATPLSGDAS